MPTEIVQKPFVAPVSHVTTPAVLNLLIVDDDRIVREACREAAAGLGYRAMATESADQAIWLVASQNIDVVVLGLRLSDVARLALLSQMKQRRAGIEVVVLTTNGTAQAAVEAMKTGACDYLTKPFGLQEFKLVLQTLAANLKTKIETRQLTENIKSNGFGRIIGRVPEMDSLYRIISKAAQSAHPVLILGESGTGKELVARAVHYSGPFRDRPFVPVDCGSLVPTLIESELFGYVKGAFTGAAQSKQGLLAIADGGTVFLDEVGELALDLQVRSCCARCRRRKSVLSEARKPFPSTCAFWPRPTAIWSRQSEMVLSAATFTSV
jgi:DNA-binding NtrC family response regulator